MATNSFRSQKFYDLEVVTDTGEVVGNVRVKPSGVLWAPKGSHFWYGLTLAEFAKFALDKGKKQKK